MIDVQSFSEAGGHAVNEDALLVQQHPRDPDLWLACVADGQGGRAGGARAAQLAVQAVLESAAGHPPGRLGERSAWAEILRGADGAVSRDPAAGFTTLVGLAVARDRIVGASCGDSAVLLLDGARSAQLTSGQRKNPPVGSAEAVPVPFTAGPGASWRVLVVTDGVWKYVGWERMADLARRERGAALLEALQQAARLPGSGRFQDDFTVVLLEAA